MEHQIKEFISPALDKSLKSYKIVCPLHYFAFGGFKEILLKSGYELIHPQGIFFHRPSLDLIYAEAEGFPEHYSLGVLTTLDFQELEDFFLQAFLEEYKNKYVLVEGTESVRIRDNLSGPNFDEIRYTLPRIIVDILENSLWNFEDVDIRFKDRQERIGTLAGFLLETFEGLSQVENVILVATSNNVEVIEKALLRPGRIDYVLEVDKPSKAAKELVLSSYLAGMNINLPLPLNETLIKGADTFAELKGAVQHLLRTYLSTGGFPSVEEMTKMIRAWKETRLVGVSKPKEREVGF